MVYTLEHLKAAEPLVDTFVISPDHLNRLERVIRFANAEAGLDVSRPTLDTGLSQFPASVLSELLHAAETSTVDTEGGEQ